MQQPCSRVSKSDIELKRLTNTSKNVKNVFELLKFQPSDYYRAWGYHKPTEASVRQLLDSNSTFAILFKGQMVGIIGFSYKNTYFIPLYNGQHWIHYIVDKSFSGRGIVSIAIAELLEIIRDCTTITRLYAGINSSNPASIHVVKKFGFTKHGERGNIQIFEKIIEDKHR